MTTRSEGLFDCFCLPADGRLLVEASRGGFPLFARKSVGSEEILEVTGVYVPEGRGLLGSCETKNGCFTDFFRFLCPSKFPIASCDNNSVRFEFLVFLDELLSLWLLIVTTSAFRSS